MPACLPLEESKEQSHIPGRSTALVW
jgi:hypothetical protein